MKITAMVLLCACAWVSVAGGGLKSKARLLGRLAHHHKRGALPSFKLGYDIPVVTHSVVTPVVLRYPPATTVRAVKVPLAHPLLPRPGAPHAHHFPHHKAVLPDNHFHHHHHHVAPRPVVPLLPAPPVLPAPTPVPAAPIVPVAQPTATVVHPVPAPRPTFVIPQTLAPQPVPVPPPHIHLHPRPIQPVAPIPAPVAAPAVAFSPQYVLRPGNAVQTSFFATYPRYPVAAFGAGVALARPPAFLLPTPAALPLQPASTVHLQPSPLPLQPVHPTVQFQSSPLPLQPIQPTVQFQPGPLPLQPVQPTVHFQPSPASLQPIGQHVHGVTLQPTQPAPAASVPLDHAGWSPLAPHDAHTHFVQEQGNQVFEQHTGEQQFHEHQLHEQQFHDQQLHQQQFHDQQFHQQQFHDHQLHDQQLHDQQLHDQQLHDQQFYDQQFHNQQNHDQQFYNHQYHEQQLHEQQLHEQQLHQQHSNEQQLHEQQYNEQQLQHHIQQQLEQALQQQHYHEQQPSSEYGPPQVEGRSGEDAAAAGKEGQKEDDEPRFHNHIPLALQPPIDRPPEHFS